MLETDTHYNVSTSSTDESSRFETLLLELSTRFIAIPGSEIDAAIEGALRRLVEFLGVDRSTLSEISLQTGHFQAMHSWGTNGVPPVSRAETSRTYPWVLAMARAGRPVIFSRLDELPPEAEQDRRSFQRLGLRSHVALPLVVAGNLVAVLGFGAVHHERVWPTHFVQRLLLVAEIFAGALARKRAQEDIDQAVGFERLAASTLASLVVMRRDVEGDAIERALHDIGKFLRLDRVTLWGMDPSQREFRKTHRWIDEKVIRSSPRMGVLEIPWLSTQLIAGHDVCFSTHAGLPREAHTDVPALRALGIRSLLAVPLVVYGEVVGAFSLASMHEERVWPEALVRGVKLLAGVFANLRARRTAEREAEQDRSALHHMTRVSMLGQLSASIAHQLNQPLAAILGNAQAAQKMLSRDNVDLIELRAICDDIVSDDNRAAEVIRRLGALYKRGEMKLQPLDVNALVHETIDLLHTELLTRQVAAVVEVATDLPMINGERVQLQQVLLNLILNAADAMSGVDIDSRRLTLRTRYDAQVVELSVVDCGGGILPGDLKSIFEAFWSTKPGGMGIGLAICHSIVTAHGGRIAAMNNDDRGASVCVTLPRGHHA